MQDVIIIGGGIIGLSIALELTCRGAQVTVLERQRCGQAASWAAAGMLAPEAEQLTGSLLHFGKKSRSMYPQWIKQIQEIAGRPCGYWCCGILAPVFQPTNHPNYIDREQCLQKQSGLGEGIVGGIWLPEDGQVDNRQLMAALLLAARSKGVTILEGASVYRFALENNHITHIETSQGNMSADHYVLTTGAWTKDFLPLPVTPRKGQMIALFDPDRRLQHVLYSRSYIVPRQDGTIVIGATVENVGFTPGNTAAGITGLLHNAIETLPFLADLPIQSTWWGFRPHAPEEIPLLGASIYANLAVATGHYRNGILFAPLTAHLLAAWIRGDHSDLLLQEFSSIVVGMPQTSPKSGSDRL